MHITWHGDSSFVFQCKEATIVFNPPAAKTSKKTVKKQADIVMTSLGDDTALFDPKTVKGEPFVIDSPGEYEVRGVMIEGFSTETKETTAMKNTVYRFKAEDVRVCHLGYLDSPLSEESLAHIGIIDVLLLPIGGNSTLEASKAVTLMNAIEPGIVIPMHYSEIKGDEHLNSFLDELGEKKEKGFDKVIVKKKTIPHEGTDLILLRPHA